MCVVMLIVLAFTVPASVLLALIGELRPEELRAGRYNKESQARRPRFDVGFMGLFLWLERVLTVNKRFSTEIFAKR